MTDLLFGTETEYAFACLPEKNKSGRGELVSRLLENAHSRLIHLPSLGSSGMYLLNGSRFYLDCGLHLELAGPETSDPWSTVRYVEAGHRIVENLIASLDRKSLRGDVMCFRCNVDYSGTDSTWGCHESYLHRSPRRGWQAQLIPFLVTRLIFTGAGGFNPRSRGLEFSLAPRLTYFRNLVGESSTNDRPIFHTKSESLSSGFGRLHVLCGESLCSQTAGVLKIGATALVVALADAGFNPGSSVQLVDPIASLSTVTRDIACSERLALGGGTSLTAIEIQRRYLEQAIAHLHDGSLPDWAGEVCRLWRQVLDNLEAARDAVDQSLDWTIKLKLYANHARSLGIRWDELAVLNEAIANSEAALAGAAALEGRTSLESLLHTKNAIPKALRPVETQLESRGLTWDDVRILIENRSKLFETDMRFGQLGLQGIFNTLDRTGVLNHRVDAVGDIEAAMTEPPPGGRARVRGEVIRRLSGMPDMRCDWQRIVQFKDGLVLDLSNPFVNEELWKPAGSADLDGAVLSPDQAGFLDRVLWNTTETSVYSQRVQAYECYQHGDYVAAEQLLRACVAAGYELASNRCHLARSLLMMDREAEARAEVEQAWAACADAYDYVPPRILFLRCLFAMLDGADYTAFIGQIKAVLNSNGARMNWTIHPVIDHLRSRLGRKNHRFLIALADALSETRSVQKLQRFREWREATIPGAAAA